MQVMSRLWTVFGVKLSMRAFFDNPTVAGVAKQIEGELDARRDRLTRDDSVASGREVGEI